MGCNCSAHIEVKIGGKWEHYSAPKIQRYYKVFEKMAGVRGDVTNAISTPKGLPDDISVITKMDVDKDAHNQSWLSLDEFKELYEYQKYFCSLMGINWQKVNIEQYGCYFLMDLMQLSCSLRIIQKKYKI